MITNVQTIEQGGILADIIGKRVSQKKTAPHRRIGNTLASLKNQSRHINLNSVSIRIHRSTSIADGHGEKLDFDVPVTVVRRDDLRGHFQAVRSDPGGRGCGGGGGGHCQVGFHVLGRREDLEERRGRGHGRRRRFAAAPAASGRRRFWSRERWRETPASHVPHVAHGIAARALARGDVLQADGFDVGRQADRVERRRHGVGVLLLLLLLLLRLRRRRRRRPCDGLFRSHDDDRRLLLLHDHGRGGHRFTFLLPALPRLDDAGQTGLGCGARTLVAAAVALLPGALAAVTIVRLMVLRHLQFRRTLFRVLFPGTPCPRAAGGPVVLGRLYQRGAMFVRGEIGLFGQRPRRLMVMVLLVMPVRRPTVPVLQLLIVLVRRRRTLVMVPGRGDSVVPAPLRFVQYGGSIIVQHAAAAAAIVSCRGRR